jgi:mitochondrial fission protein ELM1
MAQAQDRVTDHLLAGAPARADLRNLTAWVLTDGKSGDEQNCLGVARALGVAADVRRIAPRAPFSWLMPFGPVDPREAPGRAGGPLAGPLPDLVIASGRRSVPYVRAVKKASGGRAFTVILKDPRTGPSAADLIWVPAHDRLRGPNVVVTLTSPHPLSPDALAAARENPDPRLAALPKPRVAVVVGGNSRHHRFTAADIGRFVGQLAQLAEGGASLMITASRRTPPELRDELGRLGGEHGFFWDGRGENPYVSILALADNIVVTADSINMVGEAAATGAPLLLFEPSGGHPKISALVEGLKRHGAVKSLSGRLEAWVYEPLDSTPVIAEAIIAGLARHRRALGLLER